MSAELGLICGWDDDADENWMNGYFDHMEWMDESASVGITSDCFA